MKKEITHVALMFQNDEVMTIPGNQISMFLMKDFERFVSKNMRYNLEDLTIIKTLFIRIESSFNKPFELFQSNFSTFDRLLKNDVTSITLLYSDGSNEYFLVDNKPVLFFTNQTTEVRNDDLFLLISADKELTIDKAINDYFLGGNIL